MNNLTRYSVIKNKFPREFILLQGQGCIWKNCTFCDYYSDISEDPFEINKNIIKKITGKTGTLDVINSGSCMELDDNTIYCLKRKIKDCKIHTVWFEAHWLYRKKLKEFKDEFKGVNVKFRTGVETFDAELRDAWKKGIPQNVLAKDISKYFNGICLLVGLKGQKISLVEKDIKLALKHFEYTSINIFTKNSTKVEIDNKLINDFKNNIYPKIKDNEKLEILLNNTDLGVG